MIYEKKCPQCDTNNFSRSPLTACSQCRAPLYTVDAQGAPALPGLEPCEDCRIPISRKAESCPYCGRFYRLLKPSVPERSRAWWVVTVLLSLLIFGGLLYATTVAVTLLSGGR
jgi:hypothetical protein